MRFEVALVAIERPDELLIERLLDRGLPVLALHPNQVAAARSRLRAAGGKSNRFDAFVSAGRPKEAAREALDGTRHPLLAPSRLTQDVLTLGLGFVGVVVFMLCSGETAWWAARRGV